MERHIAVQRHVKIEQPAPDQLMIVEGGGCVAAFGAIFLLPGLVLMMFGFHLLPISGQNLMIDGIPVLGLFSLPFVLIGGWLVFKRQWITLDITRRRMITQWGFLTPMFRSERSLHEFDAVKILYQAASENTAEGYPVLLTAATGGKSLSINVLKTYGEAYTQAAQLATFLSLPLTDVSTNHALNLAPAEVANPLEARLHAEVALPDIASPPLLLSQVQLSAAGVQISSPGRVMNRLARIVPIVGMLPVLIIFPIFIAHLPHGAMPAAFKYFFISIVLLMLCYHLLSLLIAYLKARRTQTLVSVDSYGMTIEERLGKTTRNKVVIPIADILDIDFGTSGRLLESKGVIVKAKSGIYTFGAGLPNTEVEYLARVVKKAIG